MYHRQQKYTLVASTKKTITIPSCRYFQLIAEDETANFIVGLGDVDCNYAAPFVFFSPQDSNQNIVSYSIDLTSDKNTDLIFEYWEQ